MKRRIIMLAIVAAAMGALAKPPPSPPPLAPVVTKKQQTQIITPFTPYQLTPKTTKVEHIGGMSSRPWTQIVGWKPGYSAFPSPETHESTMYLFWAGHEPWR